MNSNKVIANAIRMPFRTTGVNPYNSHAAQAKAWTLIAATLARRPLVLHVVVGSQFNA